MLQAALRTKFPLARTCALSALRYFSSSLQRQQTFMVWAPDYTDEKALSRRMAVRPKHLATANKLIEQGILKVAGGLIIPEVEYAVSDSRRFFGSALLFEAESLEAVRNLIEQDVYWTENVWDKDKLTIHPIIMATALQEKADITQPTPWD